MGVYLIRFVLMTKPTAGCLKKLINITPNNVDMYDSFNPLVNYEFHLNEIQCMIDIICSPSDVKYIYSFGETFFFILSFECIKSQLMFHGISPHI